MIAWKASMGIPGIATRLVGGLVPPMGCYFDGAVCFKQIGGTSPPANTVMELI
ncbi:MAG: hypothetical protein KTR15_10595 [Phycisphaeraceae bacterium]|nr:hypothetical protein [Phycisphaeraceae bacterium]